mmetsp:Transcript_45359/g.95166  ORF Transcript_45359/g.95166 Transcript_45359/m.95166 type:complete len:234 (-) Transcript_45359:141-842(-)
MPLFANFLPFKLSLSQYFCGTSPARGEAGFVFDALCEFGGGLKGVSLNVRGFLKDAILFLAALYGVLLGLGERFMLPLKERGLFEQRGSRGGGGGPWRICCVATRCCNIFLFRLLFAITSTGIFLLVAFPRFELFILHHSARFSVPIIIYGVAAAAAHRSQRSSRHGRSLPRIRHAPLIRSRRPTIIVTSHQSQCLLSLHPQPFRGRHHLSIAAGGCATTASSAAALSAAAAF